MAERGAAILNSGCKVIKQAKSFNSFVSHRNRVCIAGLLTRSHLGSRDKFCGLNALTLLVTNITARPR